MKILVFADVWFPDTTGGAGRMATQSSVELARMGHEVHAITRNTGGELPEYEQIAEGVHVHRFLFSGAEQGMLRGMVEEMRGSLEALRCLEDTEFDVAVIHQSLPAFAPYIMGKLRGIPSVYYFHSPWHEEFLIRRASLGRPLGRKDKIILWLMRLIEGRLVRRSRSAVVLSEYMESKLREYHHPSSSNIERIPGGVDISRFKLPEGGRRAARERLRLPEGRTVFLTVRNLAPRMGLENLIQAFASSRRLQEEAVCVIGGRGLLEERLKAMVRDNALESCILFWGHVPEEELADLYGAADWFVLPTRLLEGFGLVIPEAWACGTPVLGTPQGAIPDVIGTLDERHVFDGVNAPQLQEKLEEVLTTPQAFSYPPEALREHAVQSFSWAMVAEAFERVVKKAAGGV